MLSRQGAQGGSLALLKRRASVVFPLIEPILKQYRIPSDFKFLPLFESAVTNRAVSRRGAAGFWQLMPQTAQSLGLSVSRRMDERFDLSKATHAACRYLNELYDQLGSWMLVATAYNAGPNYISQLSRQHPDMHPMALPYRAAETRAYLFQAVALKELLTHPQVYQEYLNEQHMAALSETDVTIPPDERVAILASFDMTETTFAKAVQRSTGDVALNTEIPGFFADSTTTVVLLTEEENSTTALSKPVGMAPVIDTPVVPATVPSVDRLVTRSLSEGSLAEGKLCMFIVTQPITINGRLFSVGDMIHAHIDVVDPASGKVFLRTDKLTNAQTQETTALSLVATGQPHQPGVALPGRLDGWQLNWEVL